VSAVKAFDDASVPPFPATLEEAADALEASSVARTWYGDDLIDHYVLSRRAEAGYVRDIANAQVPEYEVARYFEIA
jgi:glutamine synthetase